MTGLKCRLIGPGWERRLVLAAAGLLLAGCAGPPAHKPAGGPSEEEARLAKYAEDRLFCATASGSTRRLAEVAARRALSEQISVSVKSEFLSIVQSKRKNALTENLSFMSDKTVSVSANELMATKVAERWYDADTKQHFALVVMHRGDAATAYAAGIRSALEHGRRLDAAAQRLQKQGDELLALQNDLEALAEFQRAVKLQIAGIVVKPQNADEFSKMAEEPKVVTVTNRARALLQKIKIRKLAGDNQRTYPGVGLKDPLVAQVVLGLKDTPVKNMPVAFGPNESAEGLYAAAQTDMEGKALGHIKGGSASAIHAMLDLGKMAPGLDPSHLAVPQGSFQCCLPTKSTARFAISSTDYAATDTIAKALSGCGCPVVKESQFPELRRKLGTKGFLFLVKFTVKAPRPSRGSQTPYGTLYRATARYTVALSDVSDPAETKTLKTIPGKVSTRCPNDAGEAVRRAKAAAAAEAAEQIAEHAKGLIVGGAG